MLPIGLSLFSFGYLGGFARRAEEQRRAILSVEQLIALAKRHGLSGIELPLDRCYPGLPAASLARLKKHVADAGLFLSIDAEVVDDDSLPTMLESAGRFGESFVRVKLSKTLGGSRYLSHADPDGWFAHTRQRLTRVAPMARDRGMTLAIENHQDVTSHELLRLIDAVGEDVLGVNLDTGSALATCEDPVAFAEAVAPAVRNVHLKDYRLVRSADGVRLVRCALGAGVVDFTGIFRALERASAGVRASIELGAVVAREVHWLKPEYWRAYPPRDVRELVPFLRLVAARLEPELDGAWQTPWEQKRDHAVLERVELEELFRSVEFLISLGAPLTHGLGGPLGSLAELSGEPAGVR